MTHDPLCDHSTGSLDGGCECSLIAKVRADERKRVILAMERSIDGDALKVIDAVLDML
jgi:hypothetical protein